MTKEEVKKEILGIQSDFQIKDAGMALLIGIPRHTYMNCKPDYKRNHFQEKHLKQLKENLLKKVQNICITKK